ncbi:MAG: glutamine amidotransferase-related protein [Myxococcota bacterium]
MRDVLILKAGDAANPIRLRAGDYERWFQLALPPGLARLHVVHAHRNQRLPDVSSYDAVLMTGSPQSVTQPAEWMRRAADFMREAGERRKPVLGVCFGHQLLAFAYGTRVVRNPLGREVGTIEVDLTAEGSSDRLFAGLPKRLTVQATHQDIAERLPTAATLLATNTNTSVQAFGVGDYVRAVQFHPEAPVTAMLALIDSRAALLEEEWTARGGARGERVRSLLAGLCPTPHGLTLLRNFLERFG